MTPQESAASSFDPVDVDSETWGRILGVNLRGTWLTCKYVVPIMREQRAGAIVNISSLAAIAAATTLTAYKVSKAGVNALTQNLALSNARYGIRSDEASFITGVVLPVGGGQAARVGG